MAKTPREKFLASLKLLGDIEMLFDAPDASEEPLTNKPNCNCISYEFCPICDPEFFERKNKEKN